LNDTIQSIIFYKKGIDLAEKNNYEQELATLYNNYGAILKDQNNYKDAIKYFNNSLIIRTKLEDLYGVASVNLNLGDLYLSEGKTASAENYLRNGLSLAKKINSNEQEMNAYKSFVSLFAVKKNTDSILYYQKKYISAQDSLFNTRITKEIAEIQEKYNTVEREKELSQQKEQLLKNELELKNKNLFTFLLGSGLLFFSIISFGLYKRQQHKKREYKNKLALKEAQTYSKLQDQRLRISRDLHDNIGSQLTFIISSIDNLKFISDNTNEKLQNKLSEINQFANTTISQLRDTIWAMNKNEISFNDLQGRILALIEKAKLATHNTIQFNLDITVTSELNFSSIKGINIFRVIQEAINNSIKYANATEISVKISEFDSKINFEISDNGTGFDMNTIEQGNGLENMQKRIAEINGKISIQSKINKGSIIKITCNKNRTNDV
jgi:signal transduction histidine kinase